MIKILKASAGSGKTFSLAREYIKLLFAGADQYSYRHILAVTFTNKATDEMKSRIVEELDILANTPEESPYMADLKAEYCLSPSEVSAKSRRFLCNILNDYSAFSVSTIDRFFQRTLKAFSREIGQFASYQVELDKNSLVCESVDRILDSLTEDNKKLLGWLTGSVKEQLQTNGKFSLDKQLYETATALRSEEHRAKMEALGLDQAKMYSWENLVRLKSGCNEIIAGYKNKVQDAAKAVLSALDVSCVQPEMFSRKFMCAVRNYVSIDKNAGVSKPTASFLSNAADSSKWFTKATAGKLLPQTESVLEAPLAAFCALFDGPYKEYVTAELLKSQIYSLGISSELDNSFSELMKDKNVLSLDDSNTILKGIIDGSDTPFIYEKTGVRYDHFLLDEFQDTSNIQWENFRPLLKESNAGGNFNLIVGDVKQSIYRWRNSDWNLLNTKLSEEFPDSYESSLESNWRSVGSVVDFNNDFYRYAAAALDAVSGADTISGIYADVIQIARTKDRSRGNVDVMFCPKVDGTDAVMDAVVNEIRELADMGASYSDIGILVRTNADGGNIASALLNEGIPVISDDSLFVKASPTVKRLSALLSYADNPKDRLNSFLAESLDIESPEECHSLVDLCEYFLRGIKNRLGKEMSGEMPYIQAFMDEVQDWSRINGNSLQGFVAYWDSVNPKISSPEGANAVRIMTIHKSKGLAFNYVIFPYTENVNLYKPDYHWCHPAVEGTGLETVAKGIYRVNLSSNVEDSLFAKDYESEKFMQMVDALNTYYVATTRAKKGMTIISAMPSASCRKAVDAYVSGSGGVGPFSDMSQLLYWYVHVPSSGSLLKRMADSGSSDPDGVERFRLGDRYVFVHENDSAMQSGDESVEYCSWEIGDRLEFSTEASDFFDTENNVPGSSGRIKGIVLHDILSRVMVPSDLENAVNESVVSGSLGSGDANAVLSMLGERITSAEKRGWFPPDISKVRNETSIIDSDGEIYRPDRVIADGQKAIIIDYKFGRPSAKYRGQIGNYARLYREMGYSDVSAYLWYVQVDRVENVD